MLPLKQAIFSLLKSAGIDGSVEQNKALLLWDGVVGESIASNTEAQEVKHGTLIVKVTTPVWRNEIAMRKKDILSKLNKKLDNPIIKNIRLI
jgi:predicted nucleic acid-binding Zn ribbon protein|tara:strand:- start:356 stop:631 length:276 start_codon:yes stop_codon:yes gene_type:complete